MNEDKNIHESQDLKFYTVKKYTVGGFLFGLFFPFFSWIILLMSGKFGISFAGISKMHLENLLLFIIDLAPFVIGFSAFFLARRVGGKRQQMQKIIEEKNKIIQQNAQIARRIGEGDFSIGAKDVLPEDNLGKALLLMRDNLVQTYQKETEQNWIAKGKERIADILRKHNNIELLAYEALVSLINYTDAIQGSFYIFNEDTNKLVNVATYAYNRKKYVNQEINIGEGLIGQAAYELAYIYRKEIPEDYVTITSGIIGDKKPKTILISPFLGDEKLQGVIEIASLSEEMPRQMITLFKELSEVIGQTLFNLQVNVKTEKLLQESQDMTKRLRKNEEELTRNAEQMKLSQIEIEKSNIELAAKIEEVERAQNRVHALLQNASEVITIYDVDGIVQYVSPSVKQILGFDPEEMVGTNRFKRGESVLQDAFTELIENPELVKTFEYRYENKNKELLWLETVGRNLTKNAAIGGILFNTRDITVRKIAEKAQRLSGEMQALSENSLDMILRLGADGKVYYANPMVKEFLNIEPSNITEKNITQVNINKDVIVSLKNILDTVIETGKQQDVETIFPTETENKIVLLNVIPEYNDEKELETVLFVAHDITERKRIELEIEKKNKNITESINYAKRIQTAIIPNNDLIKRYLPKSFIFYRPRDVVSGDFPWFFIKGDFLYIAAVDCTGHGVPGALLSFIGYFILNNIVDNDNGYTAGEILDKLHFQVRKTLKQDTPDANARDGMDIALCKIDTKKRELQYSGAHRPLYLVREKELTQYKGSPKAVGGIPLRRRKEADFITHSIKIENKDRIFIFSDGLPDQIGGETGRKYQAKRIRQAVIDNNDLEMALFQDYFNEDYLNWKGKFKQIDDILLIGIEF